MELYLECPLRLQAFFAGTYMGFLKLTVEKGKGITKIAGTPILLGGNASSSNVKQDEEVRVAFPGARFLGLSLAFC